MAEILKRKSARMIPLMEPHVISPEGLIGHRVALPSHFVDAVTIEDVRPLGSGAERRFGLTSARTCGTGTREFRNRIGLAVPDVDQAEALPNPLC